MSATINHHFRLLGSLTMEFVTDSVSFDCASPMEKQESIEK